MVRVYSSAASAVAFTPPPPAQPASRNHMRPPPAVTQTVGAARPGDATARTGLGRPRDFSSRRGSVTGVTVMESHCESVGSGSSHSGVTGFEVSGGSCQWGAPPMRVAQGAASQRGVAEPAERESQGHLAVTDHDPSVRQAGQSLSPSVSQSLTQWQSISHSVSQPVSQSVRQSVAHCHWVNRPVKPV